MAIEVTYYPYYNPSAAAAGVMCGLFAIGFVVSTFQTVRYKSWIWCVMLLSIAMETIGFGARVGSANNHTNRTLYIVQFCLVILAPVFMAGIIYVAFGRIVFHVVPPEHRNTRLLWVPPRWLTPIFVCFDIFALLLQLIGAVIISGTQVTDKNAASKLQTGKDIALAGVSAQIGAFGLFSIIAARFHFTSRRFAAALENRYQRLPPPEGNKFVTFVDDQSKRFKPEWRKFLYVINFSCIMIIIRSIYREIEFATGKDGYTQKHEWFTYVLDALPIFLLVLAYTITPPGAYVSMGYRQQPKRKDEASPEAYPMRGISSSD